MRRSRNYRFCRVRAEIRRRQVKEMLFRSLFGKLRPSEDQAFVWRLRIVLYFWLDYRTELNAPFVASPRQIRGFRSHRLLIGRHTYNPFGPAITTWLARVFSLRVNFNPPRPPGDPLDSACTTHRVPHFPDATASLAGCVFRRCQRLVCSAAGGWYMHRCWYMSAVRVRSDHSWGVQVPPASGIFGPTECEGHARACCSNPIPTGSAARFAASAPRQRNSGSGPPFFLAYTPIAINKLLAPQLRPGAVPHVAALYRDSFC